MANEQLTIEIQLAVDKVDARLSAIEKAKRQRREGKKAQHENFWGLLTDMRATLADMPKENRTGSKDRQAYLKGIEQQTGKDRSWVSQHVGIAECDWLMQKVREQNEIAHQLPTSYMTLYELSKATRLTPLYHRELTPEELDGAATNMNLNGKMTRKEAIQFVVSVTSPVRNEWEKILAEGYLLDDVFNAKRKQIDEIHKGLGDRFEIKRYLKKAKRLVDAARAEIQDSNIRELEKKLEKLDTQHKNAVLLQKKNKLLANTPMTERKYDVVVLDPPWPMKRIERDVAPNQSADLDYPVMEIDEIIEKGMPNKDDAHVFMWTTQKFYDDARKIFSEWGVNWILDFVWVKDGGFQPFGLPMYTHEYVLYGRIGKPLPFPQTKAFRTTVIADRGRHSEKPQEFFDMIKSVTDGFSRIDVYSRQQRDGYDNWGNEA